jgi:hypothetical protein
MTGGLPKEELRALCIEHGVPVSLGKTEQVARINASLKAQGKPKLPSNAHKRCGGGGGNAESLKTGRTYAALKMIMTDKQYKTFSKITDKDKKKKRAEELVSKLQKCL